MLVLLFKRFVPESTRVLADGRRVTVKGYARAGDAVPVDAKAAAAKRPQDFTVDMFSGSTKHEAGEEHARSEHDDMLWEAASRHQQHLGLAPAAVDRVLSNPRAHAAHIERHAVHRMDPEWQQRYAKVEKAAPKYDAMLRKAAQGFDGMEMVTWRRRDEPTDAQLRSGNYRKRRTAFQGLPIAIETEAGGVRRGVNKSDGHAWEQRMPFAYGYLEGTLGVDGDEVDCFLGLNPEADTCFVVRARRWGAWSKYDEDKLMLGFDSPEEAARVFLLSYSDPRFLGEIDAVPMYCLADWLKTRRGQPLTRNHLES